MTPSLRKRHRLLWLVLAIALPLLFVLAILNIPEPATQEQLYQTPTTQSLP